MSTSPSSQTPAVIGEKRERVEEPSSTPAAASPAATTPAVAEPPVAKAPPKTILRMKSASKTPTASNAASPILIRPPPPASAGPIRRISSASSPLLGLPSLSVRSASVILGGTTRNVGETPATPTTPGSPQSFSSTTISLSGSVSGMPNKEHRFAPALIRALQAEADSMEVAPEYLLELTEEISRCISQEVDPTSAMQTLYPFLKDAASTVLRRDIISGKRSPQSLVRLTETDLMSQEAMAKEEAAAKRRMMDRDQEELNKSTAMNSTMFKCAKCGKRDTSYYEKQVRSADEPMTLFIGCNNCRHRWRIG